MDPHLNDVTFVARTTPCGRELRNHFGDLLGTCGTYVTTCGHCTPFGERLQYAGYDMCEFSNSWPASLAWNLGIAAMLGVACARGYDRGVLAMLSHGG